MGEGKGRHGGAHGDGKDNGKGLRKIYVDVIGQHQCFVFLFSSSLFREPHETLRFTGGPSEADTEHFRINSSGLAYLACPEIVVDSFVHYLMTSLHWATLFYDVSDLGNTIS